MTPEFTNLNVSRLAARWWAPVMRGAAAIAFGILSLAMPGISLFALVILWGAYALVDGALALAMAARVAHAGRSWGWLLFEGIVGVATAILTFAWPGITAMVLLAVIAVWAVLTGIAEIAAAIRLRRQITGEWLLATSGVLSIVLGLLMLFFPGAGALAVVWMIGAYAIGFGALLVGLGLRLRRFGRSRERTAPSRGATTSA